MARQVSSSVARASKLVSRARRGSNPRVATVADLFRSCKSWDEVREVAYVLSRAFRVYIDRESIRVVVSARRRGRYDVQVTEVEVLKVNGGIRVRVNRYFW